MFEKALVGSKRYWTWVAFLLALTGIGAILYLWQLKVGLKITGMGRDVSWGFYIGNFTYLVGIAAGGVMVALPFYLHNYKAFGRIVVLGEFMAVAAVIMCLSFIIIDLGKPMRAFNVLFHPTPNSILFWDMVVLNVYLLLNIFVGWNALQAERNDVPPPTWVKVLAVFSVAWAPLIHIVTAFIYQGLPGRHYWLTAIMAPRFLASAFTSGPALLLVIALIIKRYTKFDPGEVAIQTIGKIVTYCIIINVAFFLFEVFTSFYSQIPGHMQHFKYLFFGLKGHGIMAPLMWISIIGMITASILLVIPGIRRNETTLALCCILVVISTWLDKGPGLMAGGFIPNPLHEIVEYWPTLPEALITLGVWALGFLILTVLYKIAISVHEEIEV